MPRNTVTGHMRKPLSLFYVKRWSSRTVNKSRSTPTAKKVQQKHSIKRGQIGTSTRQHSSATDFSCLFEIFNRCPFSCSTPIKARCCGSRKTHEVQTLTAWRF